MSFIPTFRHYVQLDKVNNEKYEIIQPIMSVHNLIIGTMYIDLGGKS